MSIDYTTFIGLKPYYVTFPQAIIEAKIAEALAIASFDYLPLTVQPIAQAYWVCHLLSLEASESYSEGLVKSVANVNDTVTYQELSSAESLKSTGCGRSLFALLRRYRSPGFYVPECSC